MNALRTGLCVSLGFHIAMLGAFTLNETVPHPATLPTGDPKDTAMLTFTAAPVTVVAEKPEPTPVATPSPPNPPIRPPVPSVIKSPAPVLVNPASEEKLVPNPALPSLIPAKAPEQKPVVTAKADEAPPAAQPPSIPPVTPVLPETSRSDNASVQSVENAATHQAVIAAHTRPDYRDNPKPLYPALAVRRHQEGLVSLRVEINPSGQVTQVVLNQSSGFPLLDEAAIQAVKQWEFVPARIGSLPVESEIQVPIRFTLSAQPGQ